MLQMWAEYDTDQQSSNVRISGCQVIAGLHPQSPCHFASQPAARISQTLRSYLSRIAAAM
jgi:hypothetical protein